MADKKPDDLKRKKGSDNLLDPVSKKPRDGTDQSQGSEPQNAQPDDEPPTPDVELQDILPNEYEWKLYDMGSDREASEVSSFMKKYYLQDQSSQLVFEYSKEFLQWSLRPPGFKKNWHIGVQDKSTNQLVAFIAAVPVNIKLLGKNMKMAEVKFLYVLEEPKSQGVQEILLEEMARIITPQRAQVAYGASDDFPTMPLATCQCWVRPLNLEKLIDLEFITLGEGVTVETELELNILPTSPPTQGLRKMEVKDIPSVTTLLRNYMDRFAVAPIFDEIGVGHWFLPRANIVESYVVEEDKEITHFISFTILPFSKLGVKDSTINSACSFYNVSTKAQPPDQLLMDALVLAKSHGLDIFKALDIMDNSGPVLEGLLFRDNLKHYYYLPNYSLSQELKPSQVGIVMF